MMRVTWIGKRTGAVVSAAALIAGVVTALPTGAGAAGGEQGELGIKGVGTVYAAPSAIPVLVTTAGAVATFSFEVKNTGTTLAQYNLTAAVDFSSCDFSGCPTPALAVTAGSVNITPSITGPNGYYTVPIAAGKTAVYTLKMTVPKTGVADNLYEARVDLFDTAGNGLSQQDGIVEIKDTTGNLGFDQFMNGSGQSPVSAAGNAFNGVDGVSAQTVAVGQTATYTVKLQNDAAGARSIGYHLTQESGCSSAFAVSVKAGTTDVTALALAGTYQTPLLATAKSTVLTVKLSLIASPRPCNPSGNDQWMSTSSSGSANISGVLVVNFALGT